MSWQETWRASGVATTLPSEGKHHEVGEAGFADFPAGGYPACSIHGAMLRMNATGNGHPPLWRCATCHVGLELIVKFHDETYPSGQVLRCPFHGDDSFRHGASGAYFCIRCDKTPTSQQREGSNER